MQICNLFFLSKIKNSYAHIVVLISRIRIIVAVLCSGEKKIHHMKLKYVTLKFALIEQCCDVMHLPTAGLYLLRSELGCHCLLFVARVAAL